VHLDCLPVALLGKKRTFAADTLGDGADALFATRIGTDDDDVIEVVAKVLLNPWHEDDVAGEVVRTLGKYTLRLVGMHVEGNGPLDLVIPLVPLDEIPGRDWYPRTVFPVLSEERHERHHQGDGVRTSVLQGTDGELEHESIVAGVAVEVVEEIDVLRLHTSRICRTR